MCGLIGVLVGPRERTRREFADIANLFSRLLVLSEHRGPHATGAALVATAGDLLVEKAPMPAHLFVGTDGYRRLCEQVDTRTTVLMGHTRWPTQGSHYDNENNQPLVSLTRSSVALTHNGHIPEVSDYFERFHLERKWEVDSEIVLRLACQHLGGRGSSISAFLQNLGLVAGHLAAVLVTSAQPDKVLFIRRDRPLHVAWHPACRVLLYASEIPILRQAVSPLYPWQVRSLPPDTAWLVACDAPDSPTVIPLP